MSNNGLIAVLARLKQVTASDTDAALSRALGISPQTLSSWKVRNSIPYSLCVDLAERSGISLDWLLLGKGPCRLPMAQATPAEPGSEAESQLIEKLRHLQPTDLQFVMLCIEEKMRLRHLEQRLDELGPRS
ncbi:helix-turn-helix domain-containing protein [Pseudomonas fulva]|nr:helix-turn-helix domain-containing protein [Pseudomonas fulva]MBF8781326.1 helix-turn-helix domain-containing protein [Pseudomonas fulva]